MGRRKRGYKGPEGLIRIARSRFWYIKRTVVGKDVFKSTGTSDLTEAEEIYHAVMAELLKEAKAHSVNRILGKSVPFPSVVERYFGEIKEQGGKVSRSDENSSKPLLQYFGEAKIDGITKQDVYKYMDWRKNTTSEKTGRLVSGPSINREKSFLSKMFKKAVRWGYVNENVVSGIEGFSENKRERYVTDKEFSDVLSHMAEDHREMFLSVYHTAQRTGRIYNLQWPQIDLEERSIVFQNTSKNKRVPEKLWVNDVLYEILTRRKKNRRTLSPYVFYKPSLKPYTEFDALKLWKKACEAAEVLDCTPRDLRHKAITDMKKAGFNDAQVGHVVAHSDPKTTKRYTHFSLAETKMPLQALAETAE
jgi:integrase